MPDIILFQINLFPIINYAEKKFFSEIEDLGTQIRYASLDIT